MSDTNALLLVRLSGVDFIFVVYKATVISPSTLLPLSILDLRIGLVWGKTPK